MTKFSDLKLDPKVLKAIAEAGYDKPTPIQSGAIPPALEGRDVLGIAQTGTGKTASFTLPVITLLGRGRARARMPRSLVLAPTRELAAQVAENFDIYAKYTRLTKALLIGGVSFGEQDKLIDRGVDVLIATPGRLLDHFERGKLLLTGVQIMVVDEADRMLDMGFIPDIERIFQLTPFTRQTLFFSATMAPEIERITDTFLHSPERIEVARQATASETITQRLVEITPTRKDQTAKQKRELLRALINAEGEKLTNAMIFCNRKTDVDILSKSLRTHGYDAAPIHGDLDQSQRTRTLDDFREGKLRFLVASDVAARGLDIPAVSHVFNFDLPSHAEDYVHRIGRTGRAGREGAAISISTPSDEKLLAAIEGLLKQALPRGQIPADFSLSSSAQSAPAASARRGGRNGSGRDRRQNGHSHTPAQSDSKPASDKSAPEKALSEKAAPVAKPDATPPAAERREPARAQHAVAHNDQRRDRRSGDRNHDRRRSGDHQPVMGMGEHVPDFMLRSFRPDMFTSDTGQNDEEQPSAAAASQPPAVQQQALVKEASASAAKAEAVKPEAIKPADDQQPKDAAQTGEAAAAAESDKQDSAADTPAPKKPATRRRARAAAKPPAEAEAVAETPAAEEAAQPEPAAETVAEPAVEAEAEPAKPVRKRATRTRKTAAKPADAAPAAEASDSAKPAKAKAKKDEPATNGDEAEAPAKPVRRRAPRKTAAAAAKPEDDAVQAPAKDEKAAPAEAKPVADGAEG